MLHWTLRHRWVTLAFGVLILVVSLFGATLLEAGVHAVGGSSHDQLAMCCRPARRFAETDDITQRWRPAC